MHQCNIINHIYDIYIYIYIYIYICMNCDRIELCIHIQYKFDNIMRLILYICVCV